MKSRPLILPGPDPERLSSKFRDIDDEIAFHLEMLREDLSRRGLNQEEADEEARRRFGSVKRFRNACRRLAIKENIMQKKTLIFACSALAILLVFAGGSALLLYRQAAMERELAMAHAMEARQHAMEAMRQQQIAEAASSFLMELLTERDPKKAGFLEDTTVREILDAASNRLDAGAIQDPRLEAQVRQVLESTLNNVEDSEH